MIKISICGSQRDLSHKAIAAVFLETGMSKDESDHYANEIVIGHEFEIEAPENELVNQMISSLQVLGVKLTCET